MHYYKYVIVGGGMTGDAAIGGIREVDTDGSIALFGDESEVPYNRPASLQGTVARGSRSTTSSATRTATGSIFTSVAGSRGSTSMARP